MFAGQMGCEALNFLLKRWIREERPRQMYGKGYGMPSSHSQFVTYFSLSLSLFLLFRHAPNPSATHTPSSLLERTLLSLLACFCATAVAASRVYLNYHTPKQVLVGCAAGAVFAVAWFLFAMYLRRAGWIEWGLEATWARMFRLRDLVVGEDLVDAGWERWETRRKLKRRGNGTASKKRR
jgi:dolichyldiphosphatase